MINLFFFFFVLFFSSCSFFISTIDPSFKEETIHNSKKEKEAGGENPKGSINLVFSHNISGETHPCGCRKFPLGGLPQVAGLFQQLANTKGAGSEFLYVDTGDTFFPSSVIPSTMRESFSYAANHLALGLEQLGLKYFVPGDQDFAMGPEFLKKMANERKFQFLISNLKDESTIKHKRFAVIEKNKTKLFMLGLVSPQVFNDKTSEMFTEIKETLPLLIAELKKNGYDSNNPFHRLIILSHSGFDLDEVIASEYPFIDWIIGAHSQSFLRFSRDLGTVKIVQTLSKNHYIGNITIDSNSLKINDHYALHEVRDELEKILSPNPFREFIETHKTRMNEIQTKEQSHFELPESNKKTPLKKFSSPVACIACHKVQAHFWQQTPHSLAYLTLLKVREPNNLQCIKCHSLGFENPKGFTNARNIISFKDKPIIDYWNKIQQLGTNFQSVRNLGPNKIQEISKRWLLLDAELGIKSNFSNVQCLNCHEQNDGHPFNSDLPSVFKERPMQMKKKCLECHTSNQSPEWYNSDLKTLKNLVFAQKLKTISCPLD